MTHHRVDPLRPAGVADVFDAVVRFVKHGADEVVEARVDADENGEAQLIRKRDQFEDLLRNQVEVL